MVSEPIWVYDRYYLDVDAIEYELFRREMEGKEENN